MVFALIGVSMPNFWSGLLLVMLFSLTLGWLPSQGYGVRIWTNAKKPDFACAHTGL